MTPTEAATIMRQFNEWRRCDEDIPQFDPREIGEAIDAAVELIKQMDGAQPAPIEQDTSVRKAWARFSNELHRSPDVPYPGMSEAFERHFSQSFTDREWRAESSTWAAAWKAAKRHGAQPAPSVPEGWKLVPIEPTPEMKTAGIGVEVYQASPHPTDSLTWEEAAAIYAAMISAAPESKP